MISDQLAEISQLIHDLNCDLDWSDCLLVARALGPAPLNSIKDQPADQTALIKWLIFGFDSDLSWCSIAATV